MKNDIKIYPAIARANEKLSLAGNIKYLVHNIDEYGNLTNCLSDEPSSHLLNVNKLSEGVFLVNVTSMMSVVRVEKPDKSQSYERRR
ncbi:hypothetical protein ACE1ET_00225 [Saccharicrinis sp. FJH62]|uniref:hypothetical protein n=1 Tax=Saccharicrinis sp. FJH62 TaxID=3344657 RepID=UPI0035D516AA